MTKDLVQARWLAGESLFSLICMFQVRRQTMFGGKHRDALGSTMSCVAEQLAVFFWDEGQVKIATWCMHEGVFDIYHDFSPTTNISRGSTQSGNKPEHIWPIAVITLSIHMADGVLTSCLYHDPGQNIFWHASFAKKQGGMCWWPILAYKKILPR